MTKLNKCKGNLNDQNETKVKSNLNDYNERKNS